MPRFRLLTLLSALTATSALLVGGAVSAVAAPVKAGSADGASVTAHIYLRDRSDHPVTQSNSIVLADMVNLATGETARTSWSAQGDHLDTTVPAGHYYLEADAQVEDAAHPSDSSALVLIGADVLVDSRHTTLTLDGRHTVRISGHAPSHPDAALVGVGLLIQQTVAGKVVTTGSLATFGTTTELWVTPVAKVTGRQFDFLAHVRLARAGSSARNGAGVNPTTYLYSLARIWHGQIPSNPTLLGDDARLATVANTFHVASHCQPGRRCPFSPQFDDTPVLASGDSPFAWAVLVPADGTVVEHAGPADGFTWHGTFRDSGARHPRTQVGPPEHYQAGKRYTRHWTL